MEANIRELAERKGCSVSWDHQFDRYQVHLWEKTYPTLRWVEEFYAREFLNSLESARHDSNFQFTLKDCFFHRRRISICIYDNVFKSDALPTYMEITDSDRLFQMFHINTHCSLSDRALYEQCDDDDQRYNDYWIGKLLCQ